MDDPASTGRPVLFLSFRVAGERHGNLVHFLREAVAIYEEIPGVRVRLLQSRQDADRWLEVVEYPDTAAYEEDQVRVEEDPRMRRLIERWRGLLDGPAEVETWDERTHQIKEVRGD